MWERTSVKKISWIIGPLVVVSLGCGDSKIEPVDIYAEDMCAHCRMAVSDRRFAAEIITQETEVFKFDDIGCMEDFKEKAVDLRAAATFVVDYESGAWISFDGSTIVQTDVFTPMGSGKVAFADPGKAAEFAKQHPPSKPSGSGIRNTDCGMNCCSGEKS
jgi:copper chaperone NosL